MSAPRQKALVLGLIASLSAPMAFAQDAARALLEQVSTGNPKVTANALLKRGKNCCV